jgi:hypothetical protein
MLNVSQSYGPAAGNLSWDPTTVSTFAGMGIEGLKDGSKASAEFNHPTNANWDTNGIL